MQLATEISQIFNGVKKYKGKCCKIAQLQKSPVADPAG
jgi:hypothetical protein